MSAEDFLAWDQLQTIRHEFVRGEVFAMTGSTDRHVTTTANIYTALRTHLRGTPCRSFLMDMKLRVEAADCFFYPDVMVTCSAKDAADPLIKREPSFVAEVLSTSTAAFDRGDKFAAYRLLPTLKEYLLVDTISRRCDLYRKGADSLWVLRAFEAGQDVVLESVGLTLSAESIWDELHCNKI